MKDKFIETANYIALREAIARLVSLPLSSPRMGLGFGNFGYGKTFGVERTAAQENALLFRAAQTWSKSSFLTLMCDELGLDNKGSGSDKYKRVIEDLRREERIIIIDEIDALLRSQQIQTLETIRDIHDETGSVVFFIGMEEANAKFKRHKHYYSRIVELIKFQPIGLADVKKYCELCDVELDSECVEYLGKRYPNLRQLKVIMLRLEHVAELNGVEKCDLKTFKELSRSGGVEDGVNQ